MRSDATTNKLVRCYTTFRTLEELCSAAGYVPSIRCNTGFAGDPGSKEALKLLADQMQFDRKDPRRAFRC